MMNMDELVYSSKDNEISKIIGEERGQKVNNIISNILFFPISLVFTLIFCCLNLFLIPIALVYHTFLLFSLVLSQ